ncbi:hypothetical protein E2C01_003424 [Portunus trituberculatus]|uniref:Uncharacterized protein n=1 Tax=Portunus trituberculatus TaxID=210409 RepID=A0A5B7CM66_PORTR|nr:hypothetical protein [Portunus trituberculatus]
MLIGSPSSPVLRDNWQRQEGRGQEPLFTVKCADVRVPDIFLSTKSNFCIQVSKRWVHHHECVARTCPRQSYSVLMKRKVSHSLMPQIQTCEDATSD